MLLTTFDLPATNDSAQFHHFLHYALSPTEKISVTVPTLFHHTWFQLTNYFDTVATLPSPRLSASDEWLHRCSDTFFTTLILQATNFPITVPTIFSPHTRNATSEYLHHKSDTLIHHAWSASDKRHHHISDVLFKIPCSPVSLSWHKGHARTTNIFVTLEHIFWLENSYSITS